MSELVRRGFWEKLLHLDRRLIYGLVFLVVLLPMVFGWKSTPRYINPWTQAFYDYLDQLPPGTPVLVAFDFEPASRPELYPMAVAVTRQLMRRDLRVISLTLMPGGVLQANQITDMVAKEEGKTYGVDYVNLGWKPNYVAVILGLGENLQRVFTFDVRDQPTAALPVLRGVHTYSDLGVVVDITGTAITLEWVTLAHQRYKVPIAAGVTSVVAVDLYPYLKTGQIVALLNGIAGAAEYEYLLEHPDQAVLAMPGVTAVHLLMVLLVVVGNVAYFATRRHSAEPELEPPEPPTGEEV